MKPLNTNSLRNALAPQPSSQHPDPDLLNAFAEGSLLADERRCVLDHLSACDECRAVLALASDAAPAAATQSAPAPRRRPILLIAIPAFSVAAAAVATFLVLHHPPRDEQRAAAVTMTPPAAPAPASNTTNTAPPPAAAPAPKTPQPAETRARVAASAPLPAPPSPQPPALASASPAPATQVQPATAMEQVEVVPAPTEQTVVVQPEIPAGAASGGPAPAQQKLHGAIAGLTPNTPSSAFSNTITTQALAKAAATPMARPHWRINHQNQPERAFGSGPWQTVLPADAPPMRVLATAGADVWIGGDNTQLYHSADNGQTWSRIALPEKAGSVHTLAHIQIDSPTDITIRATDNTTWTTSTAGATWK